MGGYDNQGKEQPGAGAGSQLERSYSATQRFFLMRLERLLRLREEYESLLDADDWETRLLTKAIYSTYCDCLQLGVGAEARERLARKGSRTG